MKPLASNLRIDQRLTTVAQAITNEDFISDKIFPIVKVAKPSGNIAQLSNDHLRIFDGRRSNQDVDPHMVEWGIGDDLTYKIQHYDYDFTITDLMYDEFELPFQAQANGTMFLKNIELMRKEANSAEMLSNASVLTNTATPSTLWDVASSDPLGDMETAAEAIRAKIGRRPNYAITNSAVISKLKNHPDFLARISGVQKNFSTADVIDIIKNFLNIKEVYVGSAIYESAIEGQTSSRGDLWQDDFLLYWKPNTGSLWVPSFGYRFEISSSNVKQGIFKYRNPNETGDVIRNLFAYQDKILDVNSAYLLDQVIS